jgi:hypothetical protein
VAGLALEKPRSNDNLAAFGTENELLNNPPQMSKVAEENLVAFTNGSLR